MGNKKNKFSMSKTQVIALGFLVIILTGTLLLMLPAATRTGESASFMTALFTAVSASCVTGLIVVDTFTYWSTFGQIVIISLIQIGGLGFMSIGIFLLVFFRRKVGLKERDLMQESVNALQLGGMVRLVKLIILGTVTIELLGAVLLATRFIPLLGVKTGIYYSIFHSISGFCNAGFDLMGRFEEYSSLCMFYDDPIVNLTIMGLITIGGLGFLVWQDVLTNGIHFKKYRLHTKMVLVMTAAVLVVTTAMFMVLEWNNTMKDMDFGSRLLCSMFSTVTARTAGFNTVDIASLTDGSKLLTVVLMFVGGSPGSTAGGIKTTTMLVVILYLWSNMRNSTGCNIWGRRLDDEVIKKASLVFYINLILAISAAFIICCVQSVDFMDILLEVFSAMGTVGMSTGITREMCSISKVVLILLMYCGRIGSMTFAMSFIEKRKPAPVKNPIEKITVG